MPPLERNAITVHFCDVYSQECHKPLQHVHKLTETVLKTKIIEKVNVKLAMALLNESTICAMRVYEFDKTATMLHLFFKIVVSLECFLIDYGKHKLNI